MFRKTEKIAVLSPGISETLFEMGLEAKICAVSQNVRPVYWTRMFPVVLENEDIHVEKLRKISPDLVLADVDDLSEAQKKQLEEEGLQVHLFKRSRSIEEILQKATVIGELTQERTQAHKLCKKISFRLAQFADEISVYEPIKTAFFIGKEPYEVVADNSYINELLSLNRLENVYANVKKKQAAVSLSTLKLLDTQLILLPSMPLEMDDADAMIIGTHTEHTLTVFVPGGLFLYEMSVLILPDFYRQMNRKIRRDKVDHLANRGAKTYFSKD